MCTAGKVCIPEILPGEDVFAYVERRKGTFHHEFYKAVIGAANEYKEGDDALGISADNQTTRDNARTLLANTKIGALADKPMVSDEVYKLVMGATDAAVLDANREMTMAALKDFLLTKPEADIKALMVGLPSDIIGMIVKLMTNDELIKIGQTVFNPLPGTNIGAKGYMGARIQPNSPTDHPEDILWQVFNGWAFAVGDVVLGNNPVSSLVSSVHQIELTLKDVLETFGVQDILPHCCLAHIDVQAEVEKQFPGSTALWFQSLGSTDPSNATFDVTAEKMLAHAATRTGKYGLYFETGQGADATNGHGDGFDMVVHEARKYGFARALHKAVGEAQAKAGNPVAPWVHLNDVAGFIGPEIFRDKEQLVRCCLEDIAMGKLHGLPIGLDICSTLHMSVSLDDLDWCIEQIMPANPAYLMALPTKNDPMLSYLTTAFQDHVRIRENFGYKVEDKMWQFFQTLGVIDAMGKPTQYFGNVKYVYAKYLKAKGDMRTVDEIMADAATQQILDDIKKRGVFIAEGHGANPWDLNPTMDAYIRFLYEDGKKSIFAELPSEFVNTVANAVTVWTGSKDREDYILHPPTGEKIKDDAVMALETLRDKQAGAYNVQIMISDGLNAYAITDQDHLAPYLSDVRTKLEAAGYKVAPEHIVCTSGRVRAGYHAGEILFGQIADKQSKRAILHIIGERPGSEHHSYSVYISAPKVSVWSVPGTVDHDITKVVAGIADTALLPTTAADQTLQILGELFALP
ncbi:MAG: ethanolamine ammonia-lyase subunit EutB [Polyangiaceae bacterium]|nr:ethanolamine ammonia-lyase subunit EutB [Polyangiaceae bacterium]